MPFNADVQQLNLQATGFSLLELTVVILILGIMAVVMIPEFSSTDPISLDLAAEKYASAIRFARSESIRTGKPHGFRATVTNRRLRVASLNESTSPWTLVYNIYHPVSRKIYDFDLDNITAARDILLEKSLSYRGTCNTQSNLYFDKDGSAWCTDPDNVALITYNLTLSQGSHSLLVSIDGITGRVTVQ